MRVNPRLYNWLKNVVNIKLLTHFSVGICRHLIKIYVRFEIIAYRSLTQIAFFIFFVWFFIFLNKIRTILFTWLANNTQLALRIIIKVNFIIKSYTIPVFPSWISFFYYLRSCFAIARHLLIDSSLFIYNTLAIIYKTYSIFHRFFYTFQSNLIV